MTSIGAVLSAPFSRGDSAALRAALLIPPSEALTQMTPLHAEPSPILERARDQFAVFASRLAAAGVHCISLDDPALAPLSPFFADAAVMFAEGAFLMRPSDVHVRCAVDALAKFLTENGVPIVGRIEAPGLLDGGDVVLSHDSVYVGVTKTRQAEVGLGTRGRGNALGREQLAAFAKKRNLWVHEIAMAGEVRRLRSVFSIVDPSTAVVAGGLVDADAIERVKPILVPRGEDLAAGVLALEPRRVLANLRFRESLPLLRKSKLVVDAIDLWEFGKVGATPSSMVLALKRD